MDEEVHCPGVFGELALQAIQTAKELTEELRQLNPEWKEYLFIVPTKNIKTARVLRPQQINEYLNGQGTNAAGIMQRYNIPGGKITTHNFRATRATNAWLGGMQVHEVAYDLGHASAEMTVRHYIVGNEESRRRLQFLMEHGALSGALEDIVGGREIIQTRLGKRHVEIMKRQGRILTPTRYGYCALPACSGPCPTANPCYIGPGGSGEGCVHHVLSPDASVALYEDKDVLEYNIIIYEGDPDYGDWVRNQRNQLQIVNRDIERAESLQSLINGCGSHETCRCAVRASGSDSGGCDEEKGSRKETEDWLWDEFNKIKVTGEPIGPTAFAKKVGINRAYLYEYPSLVAAIWEHYESKLPSVGGHRGRVTAGTAKKREIDAKVRREHTQWSVEIEGLRQRLEEVETTIATLTEDKRILSEQFERFKRLYEYLLMLAVEAGVSPSELERIQEQIMRTEGLDLSTLKKA